MKMCDIPKAEAARRALESFESRRNHMRNMLVIGVTIGHRVDDPSPINLSRHGAGGTGTMNSIGFPDDLQTLIQRALEDWIDERVTAAENTLRDLGVDIAA